MTNLDKILKAKGISQSWLAKKINRDIADVNRWTKGVRIPSESIQKQISATLNVPIDILFKDVAS